MKPNSILSYLLIFAGLLWQPDLRAASTTTEITVPEKSGFVAIIPVAASTKLYAGAMISLNSSGYAVTATDTAGQRVIGRCAATVDNSTGSAGALSVRVRRGVFGYTNSSTNALTQAHVGKFAYVEDDHTVANTATNKTKAGYVVSVETNSAGVTIAWIDFVLHYNSVPTVLSLTSSQNATATATDLATAVAMANALKTNYNALQVDVAALLTALQTAGVVK